jgi:hypothetical protein
MGFSLYQLLRLSFVRRWPDRLRRLKFSNRYSVDLNRLNLQRIFVLHGFLDSTDWVRAVTHGTNEFSEGLRLPGIDQDLKLWLPIGLVRRRRPHAMDRGAQRSMWPLHE